MGRHENPLIALANDNRLLEAGSVGLIRSKENASGLAAMGEFYLPTAKWRCRQRRRKKTEAILRMRIIMIDQFTPRNPGLATAP